MIDFNTSNAYKLREKFNKDGFVKFKIQKQEKLKKLIFNLNKYDSGWYTPYRFLNPHKKIKLIKKIFKDNNLKKFIKIVLDEKKNLMGLQSEILISYKNSPTPAHQDDFYMGTGENNSVNLWIPFQNTNKKNGTLFFIKKINGQKLDYKKNLLSLKRKKVNLNKKFYCNCKFGEAVLISNRIFHGTDFNYSKKFRYSLILGYIKKGKKFKTGKTMIRKSFKI